jgi:four helix bundle protein
MAHHVRTPARLANKPYERLKAWTASHGLVIAIYRATATWPRTEQYGLTSQARRSAFSAAANIVEGSARRGPREFRRFLDIALGSLAELAYIVYLADELGFVQPEERKNLDQLREHADRLTWGLYQAVKGSLRT